MEKEISYKIYRTKGEPKAIIQICHGMSEHKERYIDFAKYFVENNYCVVIYDHRGHGNSVEQDDLGYFGGKNGWQLLVDDAYAITKMMKEEIGDDIPFILFGHSMGSIVARCYLQKYEEELDGLILSGAPCPNKAAKMGKALANAICKIQGDKEHSNLLAKITTGKYSKAIKNAKTKFDWLSVDEENVQNYINDPLCGFDFTNRGNYDLCYGLDLMSSSSNYVCKKPQMPIYFIAGESDPVIGGKKGLLASITLLKSAGYENIRQELYDDMRHEILQEKQSEMVYSDIVDWINCHVLGKK